MDTGGSNPWVVLGIPEGSSLTEARRAFRRLVKEAHPDAGGDAGRFAAIAAAFEELRPVLRRPTPYDAALRPARAYRIWREAAPIRLATVVVPAPDFAAILDAELARLEGTPA
jgi:curved DNA-binding protein CbpA